MTPLDPLDKAEFITDQYLYHAVKSVDARLGEGYAKKNPQLVSTMVSLIALEHKEEYNHSFED